MQTTRSILVAVRCAERFWREQRAEGTSTGALRIAVWVVVALAVIGVVGPKIYAAMSHGQTCEDAAATQTTAGFVSGQGSVGGC